MTASTRPPKALWLPYQVPDIDAVRRFYIVHMGLTAVDRWARDGERGIVLAVPGGAYLEFVSPGTAAPAPLAFEVASPAEVDASFAREWPADTGEPHHYPRGHYGFETHDPAGAPVMVWSEK